MKKFAAALLCALLLATLVLPGCQNTDTTTAPTSTSTTAPDGGTTTAPTTTTQPAAPTKDTLTVMGIQKSEGLDPVGSTGGDSVAYSALFDRLTKYNDDFSIAPLLAESWKADDDGVTVDFTLRTDVKFHDGTAMTADDVVYSFNALRDSTYGTALKSRVVSVEKVDAKTVRIVKVAPYVKLLEYLAGSVFILPQAYHSADPAAFAAKPIGTGSYILESIDVDGSLKMKANENYFLGAPAIPNLVVKPPLDPAAALLALETGSVDYLTRVPELQFGLIEGNKDLKLVKNGGFASMMVYIGGPVLGDNVELRKAIFHAINPASVMLVASEGQGEVNTNQFSKRLMGEFDGIIPYDQYDTGKAAEALAKAGYNGEEILITCEAGTSSVAQAIQGDLMAAGLTVEIEQLDMNAYYDKLFSGTMQMEAYQMGGASLSIVDILFYLTTEGDMDMLYAGKSAEYDDTVKALMAAVTPDETRALMQKALQLLYDRYTLFGLYTMVLGNAYADTITNVPTHSTCTYVYYFNEFQPK